jgi:hypothetical protein
MQFLSAKTRRIVRERIGLHTFGNLSQEGRFLRIITYRGAYRWWFFEQRN